MLLLSNSFPWLPRPYRKSPLAQRQEVQEPGVMGIHHLVTVLTLSLDFYKFQVLISRVTILIPTLQGYYKD